MALINVTRIYTDINGDSHFEDEPVIMEEKGEAGWNSYNNLNSKGVQFMNLHSNQTWDFHQAISKMYAVILNGEIEIQTSDGEKRRFEKGNVIYFNDVSGKGHKATVSQGTVSALVVHMN